LCSRLPDGAARRKKVLFIARLCRASFEEALAYAARVWEEALPNAAPSQGKARFAR